MAWKRKLEGGILGLIGFMLSPLSWWNDALVNLPLALGFGWLVGLVYRPAFEIAVVLGYWLTDVLGFVLMHYGARKLLKGAVGRAVPGEPPSDSPIAPDGSAGTLRPTPELVRREWKKDLLISLLYTGLILVLMKLKIFQPLEDYFGKGGS